MQSDDIVRASEFCVHHSIELSFIHSLQEHGLVETVIIEETLFLPTSQLPRLEKILRLHFDLDINLAGVETITHLLERIESLQEQITKLNNRLKAFEGLS
jgi:hypothetical protein